jgi:hypothetical protein
MNSYTDILEDNFEMDLKEMGVGLDWIYLTQVRDKWWAPVITVLNLLVFKMLRIS